MKLGIFYSNPRIEEKMLFAAAEADPEIELVKIRDEEIEFDLHEPSLLSSCDAVLLRSVSNTKNFYAAKFIESHGKIAVNSFHTVATCGDKAVTSLALAQAGVPTPRTKLCFDEAQALRTIEAWGYPVVLKPVVGSWGRLLSKINDRDAAETVLEHKSVLGGINHSNLFYVQEFIEKVNKSDIRAVVVGREIIAAMTRQSDHWITNTARGGSVQSFKFDTKFTQIVLSAVDAVTGGRPALLGVDLVETSEGYKVVEVNSGVEWHGLMTTTEVNVPEKVLAFCKQIAG